MLRKQSALTASTNIKSLSTNQITPAHSQFFKTVSREKNPAWGNRFVRDSYDLTYDAKHELIKQRPDKKVINYDLQLKESLTSSQLKQSQLLKSSNLRNQINNKIKESQMQKAGIQPSKYSVTIKHNSLLQIPSTELKKFTNQLRKFGLSSHQFKETIQGKIQNKSSNHIKFDKNTSRKININQVFYRKDQDIDPPLEKNPKIRIHKSHSFKSYTNRKVFQSAQSLDKFYKLNDGIIATKPTIQQGFYDMSKPSGRKELPKKEGTQLSYNYEQIIEKIKPRIMSSKISESKRQIRFSKQVISNVRGCSR